MYLLLLTFALGALSAAPWVPTRKKTRRFLFDNLELRDGETVCDIGCGNAGLLFEALDRNPRIRAVGIDVALPPLLYAMWHRWRGRGRYANLRLVWGNFYWRDLGAMDTVFCFLLPRSYGKVTAKLAKSLKDSARVIVEGWPLPGIEPLREIRQPGGLPFFFYEARQLKAAKA